MRIQTKLALGLALICAGRLAGTEFKALADWAVHAAGERQSGDCAAARINI